MLWSVRFWEGSPSLLLLVVLLLLLLLRQHRPTSCKQDGHRHLRGCPCPLVALLQLEAMMPLCLMMTLNGWGQSFPLQDCQSSRQTADPPLSIQQNLHSNGSGTSSSSNNSSNNTRKGLRLLPMARTMARSVSHMCVRCSTGRVQQEQQGDTCARLRQVVALLQGGIGPDAAHTQQASPPPLRNSSTTERQLRWPPVHSPVRWCQCRLSS